MERSEKQAVIKIGCYRFPRRLEEYARHFDLVDPNTTARSMTLKQAIEYALAVEV